VTIYVPSFVADRVAAAIALSSEVRHMLGDHPAAATIATADLARARTFYEESLGLKVDMEDPGGILYVSGESRVLLYPSQFAGPSKVTVVSWMVDDLDRVVGELSAQGITFEQYDFPGLKTDERGIADAGNFKGAWFKDPDGNILNVGQQTPTS
jgi:catechol 2,3-dioxygenase-like lactoylglutathione lyase family enzyme